VQKIIIQQFIPDLMHQVTAAMCKDVGLLAARDDVLYTIGQL